MFAFNLEVPAGSTSLDASLDFLLSPPGPTIDFSASGAAKLFILMWNQVTLYPKGWPATQLIFVPSLTIPMGWKFNTALPDRKPVRQFACSFRRFDARHSDRFASAGG